MKNKAMIISASFILLGTIITAFKPGSDKSPVRGADLNSMDKGKDPRNDFFNYANGNWVKNNPIPASESSWGAFNELAEKNRELLKKIIEDAAADKSAAKGSIRQKVGDYYSVAMDTVKLEKEGMTPI